MRTVKSGYAYMRNAEERARKFRGARMYPA